MVITGFLFFSSYIFWQSQQHVFTALHMDHSLRVLPLTQGLQSRRVLNSFKCGQTMKRSLLAQDQILPSHCFSVHILAVSHFTLQVCQNSTSSAAKYHKNKYSHRRCWASHAPQLTDSAWHERIWSRSFSTSALHEVMSAFPLPVDVSWL